MPTTRKDVLGGILKDVRRRLRDRIKRCPLEKIIRLAKRIRPKNFIGAIRGKKQLSVIAEVKRSSPSAGLLAAGLDPVDFSRRYKIAGAAGISVLTEEDHFGGTLDDLKKVSENISLPVLRKDFILDEYQVYESRAWGASAVLLIVRALSKPQLLKLHRLAQRIRLAPLVEVHNERELEVALSIGATLIGVNNRNLETLKTDLSVSQRLLPLLPGKCVAVAESGYSRWTELAALRGLADAVLIGTAFLKNPGLIRKLVRPV